MTQYDIVATEWRSGAVTVGFVAYNTGFEDEWNSTVGYKPVDELIAFLGYHPHSEEDEAQHIAAFGAKIEWNIAREIFPYLDITKHKYYPKKGKNI